MSGRTYSSSSPCVVPQAHDGQAPPPHPSIGSGTTCASEAPASARVFERNHRRGLDVARQPSFELGARGPGEQLVEATRHVHEGLLTGSSRSLARSARAGGPRRSTRARCRDRFRRRRAGPPTGSGRRRGDRGPGRPRPAADRAPRDRARRSQSACGGRRGSTTTRTTLAASALRLLKARSCSLSVG